MTLLDKDKWLNIIGFDPARLEREGLLHMLHTFLIISDGIVEDGEIVVVHDIRWAFGHRQLMFYDWFFVHTHLEVFYSDIRQMFVRIVVVLQLYGLE